jgi:hypothetical protein
MGNDKITIFYDRSKEFDVESMSYHIKHHISFRNKEFGYAAWWAFSYRYGLTNLCEILELVVKRKIKAKKNIRDRRGKYRKD